MFYYSKFQTTLSRVVNKRVCFAYSSLISDILPRAYTCNVHPLLQSAVSSDQRKIQSLYWLQQINFFKQKH